MGFDAHLEFYFPLFIKLIISYYTYMRAAPKVEPPILLCWPSTSEVDIDSVAVEVTPSHQYYITFCCRVTTDGRRGTI